MSYGVIVHFVIPGWMPCMECFWYRTRKKNQT